MPRQPTRGNLFAIAILSLVTAGAAAQGAGSTSATTPPSSGSTTTGTPGGTAGASATAGTASGGTAAARASAGASALDRADRKFVEEAAMGGLAEVELGNLAQQKAGSEQVKSFAQRLTQDHGKANEQLKQTASAKGVQVPSTLDRKHRKDVDRLQKLAGAAFDREFMKHMVADHRKDVKAFQKASTSAHDGEVKSFASATLPTLQEHLKMAQSIDATLKSAGKSASTKAGEAGTAGTSSTGGSTSGSGTAGGSSTTTTR